MYAIRGHVYVNDRRFFMSKYNRQNIKCISIVDEVGFSTEQYFSYIQDEDSFDKLFARWCLTPPLISIRIM
jgi:AraC-like DNA-binding protein